jgi:ubiquinone biosynthesis UbiH/UbiF/VisC/COQ6 family hydroxylase
MNRTQPPPSAVVVGGGILGALSALTLARLGLATRWVGPPEAAQRADHAQARAYALAPTTVALLERLGVWAHLATLAQPVVRMEVCQVAPAARLDFLAADVGEPALAQMVTHADLLAACEATVRAGSSNLARTESVLSESELAGLQASLGSRPLGADLLVAADGANSVLRRRAGLLWSRRDYGQQAVVAAFQTEKPHHGVACQWFGPEGILALLPLRDPHMVSMVFSVGHATAQGLLETTPQVLALRISTESAHRLGALSAASEATATPLVMMSVNRMVAGRMALVGDAGHTVHPLAGYGLNLGVQDLLALETQLLAGQARAGSFDPGAARILRAYERNRACAVPTVQWGLDALYRLMGNSFPGLPAARAWGMQAIQAWPFLRSSLVQQAVGSTHSFQYSKEAT